MLGAEAAQADYPLDLDENPAVVLDSVNPAEPADERGLVVVARHPDEGAWFEDRARVADLLLRLLARGDVAPAKLCELGRAVLIEIAVNCPVVTLPPANIKARWLKCATDM